MIDMMERNHPVREGRIKALKRAQSKFTPEERSAFSRKGCVERNRRMEERLTPSERSAFYHNLGKIGAKALWDKKRAGRET